MLFWQPKIYDSIDLLPIYNWEKAKSGELNYLYRQESDKEPGKREQKRLFEAWEKLFDEYLKRYGFTDSFMEYMNKRVKIAQLQAKYILEGDRISQTFAEIEQQQLEEMETKSEYDLFQTVVVIEKRLGYPIDVRKCSVSKFHTYLNTLKNG